MEIADRNPKELGLQNLPPLCFPGAKRTMDKLVEYCGENRFTFLVNRHPQLLDDNYTLNRVGCEENPITVNVTNNTRILNRKNNLIVKSRRHAQLG